MLELDDFQAKALDAFVAETRKICPNTAMTKWTSKDGCLQMLIAPKSDSYCRLWIMIEPHARVSIHLGQNGRYESQDLNWTGELIESFVASVLAGNASDTIESAKGRAIRSKITIDVEGQYFTHTWSDFWGCLFAKIFFQRVSTDVIQYQRFSDCPEK